MPTLTLTDEQAHELRRVTMLEAAALLRQAADRLQDLAEQSWPVAEHDAEDHDLQVRQAATVLDVLDQFEPLPRDTYRAT